MQLGLEVYLKHVSSSSRLVAYVGKEKSLNKLPIFLHPSLLQVKFFHSYYKHQGLSLGSQKNKNKKKTKNNDHFEKMGDTFQLKAI